MSELTRRQLLVFFGATAATTALGPSLGRLAGGNGSRAHGAWAGDFTPVRMPHPLPIYQQRSSFLATGVGTGTILPPAADPSLVEYTVIDDVVVSPEFERYVIVQWGERVFADEHHYVGYNHDYTACFPVRRTSDVVLWVNHEYVSFPFATIVPETPASLQTPGTATTFEAVIGFPFPATKTREALGEMLYNCGGSVVRLRRIGNQWEVLAGHVNNGRIHGLSGLAINARRTDGYQNVTSWGARPHQQGDHIYLLGTGPAALDVFPHSTDGLGARIIGTAFNCSGARTPWETVLTGEENFQGSALFYVGVTEGVKPDGTQLSYTAETTGLEFGLVGEKYGWITEVDPFARTRPRKHTALGRFRHENAAIRCEEGNRLVVYMGDDRRGGHTWRFVSLAAVWDPTDHGNSYLLEEGTLFAAHFNPDGTGVWIPLTPDTATNPNRPSELGSVELAESGSIQRNGGTLFPRRVGIGGATIDGGAQLVDTTNEAAILPAYQGKTLADFYTSYGAILVDAFLAANLVGATPGARPEDFEINPRDHREVFIAMTDGAAGSDGYPDSRIFVVGKYTTAVNDTQQSGCLMKIVEDSADGTGDTFTWSRFVQAGESGATDGTGFAAVDNLAFDTLDELWGVTDMSTELHNGFGIGTPAPVQTIDHSLKGNVANLVGVFGNNMLFTVPLSGPDAGQIVPVAYGPVRSEMTGPTWVDDTLIVSVQHPCENSPITNQTQTRTIEMLKLDGTLFTQSRTVPIGSRWPANILNDPSGLPRPCTIGIRRKS